MTITVQPGDWGEAKLCDIERLLSDTSSHLNRLFRCPFTGVIVVAPGSVDQPPMVKFRADVDEPFQMLLSARNRFWAQYALQFAHEFCHILCNFEKLRGNGNGWFHETICEIASLFCLRRMAELWRHNPPCLRWFDFAPCLLEYANERLSRADVQLPAGVSLKTWVSSKEEQLRKDPCQRSLNETVACALLPLFEADPAGWNAVSSLPNSAGSLRDYLTDWRICAHTVDKEFVNRLSKVLVETPPDF